MNTLDFFQAILPDEGIYFLALIDKNTGRVAHRSYSNLEDLTLGMAEFDKRDDLNVYHACASYKEPFIEVDGKKKYRVTENWHKAKAFWIDLDCGEDKFAKGDGYLSKKDAARAIVTFCKEHGFPLPMFVDSGNGVHCYWPLTSAIGPKSWRKLADAFKSVLAAAGVLADPTCTADFSRILRPVGSHNKKAERKLVEGKGAVELIAPEVFAAKLKEIVSKLDVVIPKEKPVVNEDLNDDLTAHLPVYMDCSAVKAAEHCIQMKQMMETQGDVSYEHWRHVIGVIKHCVEGRPLAEEWTARRKETGHGQLDWDVRYDTWSTGPSLCTTFEKINPNACAGCIYKGKVSSPIMLGRIVPEPEVQNVEAIVDGEEITVEVPAMPKGYKFENNQMVRVMMDKDGIPHALTFCHELFYPLNRIRKEDGTYSLAMRVHLPHKKTREFNIDTRLLASPSKLQEALGDYEIVSSNNKDASMHLTAYLKDSLQRLKTEAEEISTMTHYGWQENYQSFLLGDKLYHRDGTVRQVLVGGYAADKIKAFPPPIGTVEGYAAGLNGLYNRPGMQPMQYLIASGFGCVLTPFADSQYYGLLMSVTGGDSGKGKTTVCNAVLYAFGLASKLQMSGEKGATMNARYSFLSAFRNIPVLMDELTTATPEQLSELSYQVSMGHEKERMQYRNGSQRFTESQYWQVSPFTTANSDLHGKLASINMNSQAEAVRIIQIRIDEYAATKLEDDEVPPLRMLIENNRGVAGDLYMRYVVANLDSIIARMSEIGRRLSKDVPDSKYRLYRYHAMCSLAAIEVTNKLGITHFNFEALYDYTIMLFKKLAMSVAENNTLTPEDALSEMISELSPRIITTYEYRGVGDSRGPETPTKRIFGAPAGRYIIGSQHGKNPELSGKLFISKKDAHDWCQTHNVSLKNIIDYAASVKVLVPMQSKFTLGRGTDVKTGNTTVIGIDMNKLESLNNAGVKLTLASIGNAGTEAQEAVS